MTWATSCTKTSNSQTEKKMRRCLAGLQIAPVRPVPVVSERVHTASRKGQTAGRSNVTQRSCHQTVLCSIEDYGSLFHLEIAWRSNTSRFLVDDCTSHLERKSSEQFQGKRKALIYRSYVNFWTMRHLAVAYRGDSNTPPPPNFEGPPKSCQTQTDCENC